MNPAFSFPIQTRHRVRAAVLTATGPPEAIRVRDVPDPGDPGRGELRVRVGAVAVNPFDLAVRRGETPLPKRRRGAGRRYVIGCDWAGTVEAVGERCSRFTAGDRVWGHGRGRNRDGSAAEVILEPEAYCAHTPRGRTDVQAAGLGQAAVTAYQALVRVGGLDPPAFDDFVMIAGGETGVGSAAIAVAVSCDARVVATAETAAMRAECVRRGAELALDPADPRFADRIRERLATPAARTAPDGRPFTTRRGGFEVWLDARDAPDVPAALPLLTPGRAVVLTGGDRGFAGPAADVPLGPLRAKGASVRGCGPSVGTLGDSAWAAAAVAGLAPLIGRVYPLAEIARAHADLEAGDTGETGGRLVVTV